MNISIRYTQNNEEAVEVLNDAFLKVFTKGIHSYNVKENTHVGYFKSWLKKIIINTAIDHSRKNNRHYYSQEINETNHPRISPTILQDINYEEVMLLVKKLSPVYYTVFCLYVIDGYSHEEIAQKLNISIGTSKSNLSKARTRLKEILGKENFEYGKYE